MEQRSVAGEAQFCIPAVRCLLLSLAHLYPTDFFLSLSRSCSMWPDLAEVNPSRPSSLVTQGCDVTARSDVGRDV